MTVKEKSKFTIKFVPNEFMLTTVNCVQSINGFYDTHFIITFFILCGVRRISTAAGQALPLGACGQGQRGHQWRLHFAQDLGAEAQTVSEFSKPQRLQVTG